MLEAFCLEYYGSAPSIPPQLVVPPGVGDTAALEQFLSERRGARVEVRVPDRGEKRRLQELADQNARVALESDVSSRSSAAAPRRGARGAARDAQPGEPADPDRVLRHLEHPGRVAGRLDGRLPGRGRRRRPTTGSSACASSRARTTSRRWPRSSRAGSPGCGDATAAEYDEAFAAMPNLVVDRRRQGPAVGGARGDAGVRPAARRRHLPREAGGGGLRPRPRRADRARPRTRRGCSSSSGSATRRTGSRSASTGSAATRRRAARSSTSSPGSARRAGARCCGTSGRRSGCWRRSQEELEGVPGVPAKTARAIYAQLHRAGRA